ncbi:hypothetical protein [Undibacterium fentianense]|uniref:Glyoxalase-like domain-containing protein n=1 Tax=Undibacterium fentianense TaxID=2828728 RepID=A0A941E2K7_9BURK|nr:hypothetical protein [Undibacterium fentianense]MBR7799499.1 hypothetical protein [Undibacterium fentianense]
MPLIPSMPSIALVLFVEDVARLSVFYATIAKMSVQDTGPNYAILALPGFELILHAYGQLENQDQQDLISPVVVREDSYTKLCLPVAQIEEVRILAEQLGGRIKSKEHEWSSENFCACDGNDPEGNVIQVRMPLMAFS